MRDLSLGQQSPRSLAGNTYKLADAVELDLLLCCKKIKKVPSMR